MSFQRNLYRNMFMLALVWNDVNCFLMYCKYCLSNVNIGIVIYFTEVNLKSISYCTNLVVHVCMHHLQTLVCKFLTFLCLLAFLKFLCLISMNIYIRPLKTIRSCCSFFNFYLILEPSLLTPTPLQELKREKSYFKMLVKRDKELEVLKRKHEKVGVLLWTKPLIRHVVITF